MKPVALTVAGSDPSGGAGVQADLKTFHQFGVYGMSVLTLLTVQNTRRVSAVEPLDSRFVTAQLDAVMEDIPPKAAKTGALGSASVIEAVAHWARSATFPIVVDPVMVSKHGAALIADDALQALVSQLLPRATLVTPNLAEAAVLVEFDVNDVRTMEGAARRIAEMGPHAVLVKGGHLEGRAIDVLFQNGRFEHFAADRVPSLHTHGTGCTYSAAICAGLSRGETLVEAIRRAKDFVTRAIVSAPGLGHGHGPLNHHAPVEPPGA